MKELGRFIKVNYDLIWKKWYTVKEYLNNNFNVNK